MTTLVRYIILQKPKTSHSVYGNLPWLFLSGVFEARLNMSCYGISLLQAFIIVFYHYGGRFLKLYDWVNKQ